MKYLLTLKNSSLVIKDHYATIQSAINAAVVTDVIDACAGTYAENIVVNKSLTINGPNAGSPMEGPVLQRQ
ncbi:MAG: hypothetical protein IPH20_00040 [Bacteroidales bacterium]|nr:hypothetical protein [Bacteroidales bacterium]